MCKTDISDAFKLVPILPSQYHLFCVKWRNSYYFYTRLAFGCRSSPKIFDQFSQAICWIAKNNYEIECILHLLDDFLTIDRPDYPAERTMAILTLIFKRLNVPLAKNKTMGPNTVMEYLGIILDSNLMQARLPMDKVLRIREMLDSFYVKKSCTKRELLQLLGHLNFASRVIIPGRSFVSYLLRLASSVRELHHYVHLNSECREDLYMWKLFLEQWNDAKVQATGTKCKQSTAALPSHGESPLENSSRLELLVSNSISSSPQMVYNTGLPSHGESPLKISSRIEALMSNSISSSTQLVYNTGYQTFVRFNLMNNFCQNATEDTLMRFVTHCFDSLNLSYQTIKLYLCGIRHHLLLQGIPNPFASDVKLQRLHMLLNGIKRQHRSSRPSRKPITTNILLDLVTTLQKGMFSPYSDLLISTVCVVAFFGFLRCAEFTCKSSFDPESNLCLSDLMVHKDHAVLTLKQSKTDPFRRGIGIKLFRNNATLCPLKQLASYLCLRNRNFNNNPQDPLFVMENGNALTRSYFLAMLKDLLNRSGHADSGITGHSFRIGAATSAATARIEDHLIKCMGRWSSDSYLRYIRTSDSAIQHAQLSMLQSK
ncbi:uncharacterized protein LOC111130663 isoform X2 [Crassostrea virginica]